jgi:hypothetical protein
MARNLGHVSSSSAPVPRQLPICSCPHTVIMSSYPNESAPDLRDLIVFALENSGCVWSLIAWYEIVQARRDESSNDASSRRAARDIMSSCFAWATRPRTGIEIEALLDMDCTCSSATTMRARLHEQIRQTVTKRKMNSDRGHRPFFYLLDSFLKPVGSFIPTAEDLYQRRTRIERRAEWPRSMRDLMPHGSEDTTRALISLLNLEPDPVGRRSIMSTIAVLINLYRSLVIPIIVTSRTFVMRGIINTIDADYHAAHSKGSNIKGEDMVSIMRSQNALIRLLSALVMHFPDNTERRTYRAQAPLDLLRAYSRASMLMMELQENARRHHLALLESNDISTGRFAALVENWTLMAGFLLDDCPEAESILPELVLGDHYRRAGFLTGTDPIHMLYRYQFSQVVSIQELNQQCSAPGCFVNVWTGSLRRCAGCERVVYCSRACQKAAWRGRIPHRTVCKTIAALSQKLSIPKRGIHEIRDLTISSSEWPSIEANVHAIINHFDELTTLRLANAGKHLCAL